MLEYYKRLRIVRKITINPLKPNGSYMYHALQHTKTLHSPHTVYLCVLYGSHKKQRVFPQTALWRRNVFPVWYGLNLYMLLAEMPGVAWDYMYKKLKNSRN
jgi:hypothetical protein